MAQDLYFQPKFVKQRTDKDLTHKETYGLLMAWDIEGGHLFQSRLPDWRCLHAGGAIRSLHFWSLFLLLGRGSRAAAVQRRTWQEEVESGCVSLKVSVGDKDRINVSCLHQAVGLQKWTEKGEIPDSPGSRGPEGKESSI